VSRHIAYRAYYVGLLILATALLIRGTPTIETIPWAAIALWVCLMTLTEVAPIQLPSGGVITASSVLDYAALIIFGPYLTAWLDIFSMITGRAVLRTQRPLHKVVFNMALYVVTAIVAGEVYQAAGGEVGRLMIPESLPAMVAMGITYFMINTIGVSIVISLTTGSGLIRIWRANFGWTFLHLLAFVPFGAIVAHVYLEFGYIGVLLFMFPVLLARHSFKLYTEMRRDFFDFVETLTRVIEEVDPYTRHHSHRVADYSRRIAVEMGLAPRQVETVGTAALLHDIGKVSFRTFDIIDSPRKLTEEQRSRMAQHPLIGAEIVSKVRVLKHAADSVRAHHERVDGHGYPLGLKGDDIPIGARILMVADTLDAMTSDRSYRRALSLDTAIAELRRHAGGQFDPEVVAAVERLYARRELKVLYQMEPTPFPERSAVGDE